MLPYAEYKLRKMEKMNAERYKNFKVEEDKMDDRDNIYFGLNGDYIIPKIEGKDFIYLICQREMVKVRVRIRPKELKRFCKNMLRKMEI